jgi:1,2-diacylglycerol 3-beta-glucosyltransferase
VLFPLQSLLSLLLTVAFIAGLHQFQTLRGWALLWATVQGSLYMLHWIPIMILMTFRLCVLPQQFNWSKTEHRGYSPSSPLEQQ